MGQVSGSKFHGQGQMWDEKGGCYSGEFSEGKREGFERVDFHFSFFISFVCLIDQIWRIYLFRCQLSFHQHDQRGLSRKLEGGT